MSDSLPTLWHIEISHYSEKARWALAHKGVEHTRRAPPPGSHIPVALFLTRGAHYTFPILQLDGRAVGDSSAIIAALEQRYPEPPLYPADPAERRRALELAEYFNVELAPAIRLLAFYEMGRDKDAFEALMERTNPGPLAKMPGITATYARAYAGLRFKVHDDDAATRARVTIAATMDRLEQELGDDEYLVGDSFTVADLTAAALFNPLVLPEDGPLPTDQIQPRGMDEFRAGFEDRRGFQWVDEMFRRHRKPARAGAAATA